MSDKDGLSAPVASAPSRRVSQGPVMPIGGAEETEPGGEILERFADLACGSAARIVIIPTASDDPQRSGEATLDSDIMALSEGRIVAKLGAEGLLCLAVPERGMGIAIAAADGSSRALGPAAVAVIEQLALTEPAIVETLRERHVETVKTFSGEAVGEMYSAFQLEID